jgi:acetyltransferase AlgX (SGNH hydrolase-like protein)
MEFNRVRSGLFFFLFLVMFLPFLQHCFSFVESGKLNGYIVSSPNPTFSYGKWWDGSYQIQKAGFVNDSVGFRPDFVRLTNQIDYDLFSEIHSSEVYLGKNGQLFTKVHVDEYFGADKIGTDTVMALMVKLKRIQDTLERLGKTLVLAYAPSKAYYVPEDIPDCLRPAGGIKTSNYYTFKRFGDSLHINQLDLNGYFMAMKDTTKNLIMTKQGIHWSQYGALLGGDTLTKYIERIRNVSMPELTIKKIVLSGRAQSLDNELGKILNLIYPVGTENYCYPDYDYTSKGGKTKPKIVVICDSYMWPLISAKYFLNTYTDWQCWHYFFEVWNEECIWGRQVVPQIANYNWQHELLNTDCVVILFTPYNLTHFPKKDFFLEVFYNYFYPGQK